MAIKISGTTVIDDSRNIVNGVGVNISGVATATSFDGSGASLTSLDAGNISSGTLAIARGGTNGSATPTSGGVAYGNGSAYAFTSAGTAGQVFTSNGTSTPTWEDAAGVGKKVNDADDIFTWVAAAATVTADITFDTTNSGSVDSYVVSLIPNITVANGIGVTVGTGKTLVIDVLQIGDI
jgi:hypothetical protein